MSKIFTCVLVLSFLIYDCTARSSVKYTIKCSNIGTPYKLNQNGYKQYIAYKSECPGGDQVIISWDKNSCLQTSDATKIREYQKDYSECAVLRGVFNKMCVEGGGDSGHLGAIKKMDRFASECLQKIGGSDDTQRPISPTSSTSSPVPTASPTPAESNAPVLTVFTSLLVTLVCICCLVI